MRFDSGVSENDVESSHPFPLHETSSRLLAISTSSVSVKRTFSMTTFLTDRLEHFADERLLNDKLTAYLNREMKHFTRRV